MDSVERMLTSALNFRDDLGTQSLHSVAESIQAKTEGNPLFIIRFISQLHQVGAIKWNWSHVGWNLDVSAVNSAHFLGDTENWLSAAHLVRITPELQRMLQVVAIAGGGISSKVLVELAHLFLEESPIVSEGEEDGSVGGDSDDEGESTGVIGMKIESTAINKSASPNPLRSGPPSLTPVTPSRNPNAPPTPTVPSRFAIPPPNHPRLTISSPPRTPINERGSTPSQLDNLVQAFPNTSTSNNGVQFLSTSTKPPAITPPVSPPTSPITLPRFALMNPSNNQPAEPISIQHKALKFRRMDSFPRVQSLEEYKSNNNSKISKLQRNMGSQQYATSPPDHSILGRRKSADYLPTPIDTKITPIEPMLTSPTTIPSPVLTSPTSTSGPSPMALTSPKGNIPTVPIFPTMVSPPLSSQPLSSPPMPAEPDDSAWANFPQPEEQQRHSKAIFKITQQIPNHSSPFRYKIGEPSLKNKRYSTIVQMLISEAVTCSLLKETRELNTQGGKYC